MGRSLRYSAGLQLSKFANRVDEKAEQILVARGCDMHLPLARVLVVLESHDVQDAGRI